MAAGSVTVYYKSIYATAHPSHAAQSVKRYADAQKELVALLEPENWEEKRFQRQRP